MSTIHNGDVHEAMLYFAEDASSGVDTAACYPASTFMGMELATATRVKLTFRAATGAGAISTVAVTFSGKFADACRAIAGALNSNTMTVVADEANDIYMNYNGGEFSGVVAVDDVV